jgi:photosystem II stability/assembly factor-like uncharacterized protein
MSADFFSAMRRLAQCGLVALACMSSANAGVNTFSGVGPEGGDIRKIAYHPTDATIVYLACSAGFYRSTNGGESWHLISDQMFNPPSDIAVHPAKPSRVFVAVAGLGLMSSNDAGASLVQLSTFPDVGVDINAVQHIAYNSDGSRLYAMAGLRIFRSDDDGHSWPEGTPIVGPDSSPIALRTDPIDPATVYVLTGDGLVYRSTNSGSDWQQITTPTNAISDLAIAPTKPRHLWLAAAGAVWHQDEGAASWQVIHWSNGSPYRVRVDPASPTTVYLGTDRGLFRSSNNGSSWANLVTARETGLVRTLAFSPRDSDLMLIGGSSGIAGTLDSGVTWSKRNSGVIGSGVRELAVSPDSDRIYINTVSSGVHFISGSAASTTPVNNDPLYSIVSAFQTLGLQVQPRQPYERLLVGVQTGIARSYDAGATWQILTASTPSLVHQIAAASADGEILLAATSNDLFRSTNGGSSWTAVSGFGDTDLYPNLLSAPSNPSTVYLPVRTNSSGTSEVLTSEDAGVTWRSIYSTPGYVVALAVDPRTERTLYASTSNAFLRTADKGQTWSTLPSWEGYGPWTVTLDPKDPDIVYAGVASRVSRSVDAGQTWQDLRTERAVPNWDVRSLVVDPNRSNRLIVGTGRLGVREISIQPDLSLEASASAASIVSGDAVSLKYTVRNLGPFDATDVRTRVSFDAAVSGVVATASSGSCTVNGTEVTCTQRILRTAASADLKVTFTGADAGAVHASAVVDGAQADAQATNNTSTTTTTVTAKPVPPPPPPPPSGNGSAGGSGGGSLSLLMFALLAPFLSLRCRGRGFGG